MHLLILSKPIPAIAICDYQPEGVLKDFATASHEWNTRITCHLGIMKMSKQDEPIVIPAKRAGVGF